MTIHRFYVEEGVSARGELRGDTARQIARVLRGQVGDQIALFDGSGLESLASITGIQRDRVEYDVVESSHPRREPDIALTVGISLIRNERFDLVCQKLTELGVSEIVPLIAARSVVRTRDEQAWQRRSDRLKRILVEAAEQSERVTIPRLRSPQHPAEFFRESRGLMLVERADADPIASVPIVEQMRIAVGPEGGWDPSEVEAAIEAGWLPVGMGQLIMRSETATIVASSVIIQRWLAHE